MDNINKENNLIPDIELQTETKESHELIQVGDTFELVICTPEYQLFSLLTTWKELKQKEQSYFNFSSSDNLRKSFKAKVLALPNSLPNSLTPALAKPAAKARQCIITFIEGEKDDKNFLIEAHCIQRHLLNLGASDTLYNVSLFVELALQNKEDFSSFQKLLLIDNNGCPVLEHTNKVNQANSQQTVRDHLRALKSSLHDTSKNVETSDLMYLSLMLDQLAVSYINSQDKKLDSMPAIINKLFELSKQINKEIDNRPNSQRFLINNQDYQLTVDSLVEEISRTMYFRDFWQDTKHVEALKLNNLDKYLNVLTNPNSLSTGVKGLQFVSQDDKNGLKLCVADLKNDEQALAIFCFGAESFLTHFNPLQSKNPNLSLMGHAPIIHRGADALKGLNRLLEDFQKSQEDGDLNLEDFKVITMGFGVDGAVAQVLAYNLSEENSRREVVTYGLGVPNFLETDSQDKLDQQGNLDTINLKLSNDKFLKESQFSNYVAASYGKGPCSYPVFDKVSDFLNVTGHQIGDYAFNTKEAISQPIGLHELFERLKKRQKLMQEQGAQSVNLQLLRLGQLPEEKKGDDDNEPLPAGNNSNNLPETANPDDLD